MKQEFKLNLAVRMTEKFSGLSSSAATNVPPVIIDAGHISLKFSQLNKQIMIKDIKELSSLYICHQNRNTWN